jgi:hypothetical protein
LDGFLYPNGISIRNAVVVLVHGTRLPLLLLIREMPVPLGPCGADIDITVDENLVLETTTTSADEDWAWLLAAIVIAYCVHSGSGTTTTVWC